MGKFSVPIYHPRTLIKMIGLQIFIIKPFYSLYQKGLPKKYPIKNRDLGLAPKTYKSGVESIKP